MHRQFSNPASSQLIALLRDYDTEDKEPISFITDLDNNCEICMKYIKRKPRPIVGISLAKSIIKTFAMDLKEWSCDKKIWFLNITDLAS